LLGYSFHPIRRYFPFLCAEERGKEASVEKRRSKKDSSPAFSSD